MEEADDKKLSNRTTAEVSANITFDVYDPVGLMKNHFTQTIIPRVSDLKTVLFGEVHESASHRQHGRSKPLKSISEFNESSKEDDNGAKLKTHPEYQEMKTFVVKNSRSGLETENIQLKQFVINFDELEPEETPRESSRDASELEIDTIEINICEDIADAQPNPPNPFNGDKATEDWRLKTNTLNFSGNSQGSGKVREHEKRVQALVMSNSSEYSKDNLGLDLTPDKAQKSSIEYLDSSGKKAVLSDFKPQRLNAPNLDQSINSRPSFLDRKPQMYRNSEAYDRHWECLSINTNDLINSEAISLVSDKEKQGLLEEVLELSLDHESKILMVELLREKSQEEAQMMLRVARKMPWVFQDTLRKRRKDLLETKRLRKEKRMLRQRPGPTRTLTKGERNQVSLKFAIQLVGLLNNLWCLRLPDLNWEILTDRFTMKAFSLFRQFGANNLLHIKLSSLLKNILAFLLKESESFKGDSKGGANDNMLHQMSNFSPPNNEVSAKMDTARRCSQILNETFEYVNREVVDFLKELSPREKNRFLFKGFIIQICRIIIPFEKRGHQVVKNSSHWKQIYYNFLFHELKKEDRVLVEDPRNRNQVLSDNMRLPSNFKFNNSSLQGKMNLKSNYDSLGNNDIILKEEEDDDADDQLKQDVLDDFDTCGKDSDTDSDSESDSDEDLLKNYSFGKPGELMIPKKLSEEDQDYRGFDSGMGKGVDFSEINLQTESTFTKSSTEDIYAMVNDWNIYAQGSWKGLGKDLQEQPKLKQYSSVSKTESLVSNTSDPESENLQRHKISRKENKKYGLYGSLTRRFQIRNKPAKEPNLADQLNENLTSFYNSGNPNNQSQIKR